MSSVLTVTKTLTNDGWLISASVNAGGAIPREIFVYENTGTTQLGTYQGVLNVADLSRFKIWTGVEIPKYGNKYVRWNPANILITDDSTPDSVIIKLVASVTKFSKDFSASQNVTQTFTIP